MGFFYSFKEPNVDRMLANKDVSELVKVLKYKETFIRERAAKALGVLQDERSIGPLIEALDDHAKEVRVVVAESLKLFDLTKIKHALTKIETVLSAYHADVEKRHNEKVFASVKLKGKISNDSELHVLIEALQNQTTLYTASMILQKFGNAGVIHALIESPIPLTQPIINIFEQILQHDVENVVSQDLFTICKFLNKSEERTGSFSRDLLDDSLSCEKYRATVLNCSSVRRRAVLELVRRGENLIVLSLIKIQLDALTNRDEDLRQSAAELLSEIRGYPEHRAPLEMALKNESCGYVRNSITKALESIRSDESDSEI